MQERQPGGEALSPRLNRSRLLLLALLAAAVVGADQTTKTLAEDHLAGHPIHAIGPVWFRLVFNTGAAFSIGRGLGPALAILALLAVGGILFALRSVSSTFMVVAGGLVAGGALGNLADRVFRHNHGAVIDFVYTRFWPTFNVADSAITVGMIIFAIALIRDPSRAKSSEGGTTQAGGTPEASRFGS